MAQALSNATRTTLQATPFFAKAPLIEQVVILIEQRAALTARRLTEGDDLS